MPNSHIFISHASKDDPFVKELREALEGHRLRVWVDSRNLRGGSKLAPEISEAIEQARQTIVVLSPNTINSPWVRKEIQQALAVEQQKKDQGYRVIPLLLPGVEPAALALWFDEEPVGTRVELRPGGLSEALPDILAALGERLPDDRKPQSTASAKPVAELSLELSDPKVVAVEGGRRAAATATIIYQPADGAPKVESTRFTFTAPLGLIEADDISWYLEKFFLWPLGVFKERADRIEAQLPKWGELLYQAAVRTDLAKKTLHAWENAAHGVERRFSVFVDGDLPEGASEEEQAAAREAASLLLALPWELLHDGRGFLFHGNNPVRVRRRLPNRHPQQVVPTRSPIRILLVSPRPEQPGVGYIDHRISARPLSRAVAALGGLAALTVLAPPTFQAMQEELKRAAEADQPYDVVHFDGHGIYDHKVGLGGLCFEDPKDADKLEERAAQLVYAEKLAEVMRDHRIPLVFLEACQTAQAESVEASVAASLLNEGVTSVVAMTHSVLVETAQRFVAAFYHELARGARVGSAMLAGQRVLQTDTYRGRIMGAGELRLQDWFVPVLYQEEQDPRLITQLPSEQAQQLEDQKRRLSLGALPAAPPHSFIGRSRELLALERLLLQPVKPELGYAVVRGQGGEGKTTLATELARWLVETARFRRAAFVSLEQYTDARGVLDSLGSQLVPGYSVAQHSDLQEALQPVARALSDHPTLIVVDNVESVLDFVRSPGFSRNAPAAEAFPPEGGTTNEIFDLCLALLRAHPATRILFTSREALPAPFNHRHRERRLGRLDRDDAIELVSQVMKQEGLEPKHDDAGYAPQEVIDLVEAAGRHARALTLLAHELARQGVRATTEKLHELMAELDRAHPGDRENSLYASVELSLRRLPLEFRAQMREVSLFQGGMSLEVLAIMLGGDQEIAFNIGRALINVGLAEYMSDRYLRLDPALSPYLLREIKESEQEKMRERWIEGMKILAAFLYQKHFSETEVSIRLTRLELPNLVQLLTWSQKTMGSGEFIDLAANLEKIIEPLGARREFELVITARTQAALRLKGWNNAQFRAEVTNVDRMIEQATPDDALAAAQRLLQRCLDSGEDAYPEAAFNIALAYIRAGRGARGIGDSASAFRYFGEARERFKILAETGDYDAEREIPVTLDDAALCLADLGLQDKAGEFLETAVEHADRIRDRKQAAISRFNLGGLRLKQKRYSDTLALYTAAREAFDSLGESDLVATLWYQTGALLRMTNQFSEAETAFRQALSVFVQLQNPFGEAGCLVELGNLYSYLGRLQEAAKFCEQGVNKFTAIKEQKEEGFSRRALATILIKLKRYDVARQELYRAIECNAPYGYAAEIWKAWETLREVEQAEGDSPAATRARQQAVKAYLAYRRDGGQSLNFIAQIRDSFVQLIQSGASGDLADLEQSINSILSEEAQPSAKVAISKLLSILQGDRNPVLASDTELDYDDAVELTLLLEALGAQSKEEPNVEKG